MYNSEASETVAQDIDVIQGSKYGPLFYEMYFNDMNFNKVALNPSNSVYMLLTGKLQ